MAYEINAKTRKEANESSFAPVEKGSYKCLITEAVERLSSNENEMLALKCKIVGGPSDGRLLFYNVTYGLDFTSSLMKALIEGVGLDWEKLKVVNPAIFINKTIYLKAPGDKDGFCKIEAIPEGDMSAPAEDVSVDGEVPF